MKPLLIFHLYKPARTALITSIYSAQCLAALSQSVLNMHETLGISFMGDRKAGSHSLSDLTLESPLVNARPQTWVPVLKPTFLNTVR